MYAKTISQIHIKKLSPYNFGKEFLLFPPIPFNILLIEKRPGVVLSGQWCHHLHKKEKD